MGYMDKNLVDIHNALKNGEVTSKELINESLIKSRELQEMCNSFVTIFDNVSCKEVSDNLLSGIPYGAKDNYSTKGLLTTGSSNTLKNYIPSFDATVIEKLNKSGAIIVNKTALDEFGMGGTGLSAHTGYIRNPWDTSRMCAGSSSGSAGAVSYGVYPYALGSDTGDSIRKPAAYCGIVGYKPTYGMISRYGLFPYASSLDHAGVLCRCVDDAAIVVDAIKGIDENDMTTWDSSKIELYKNINNEIANKKLCYIKEICNIDEYVNPSDELKEHLFKFKEVLQKIKNIGFDVEEISINRNILNAQPAVYDVISYAEATSNLSNLTGIIFGPKGNGENVMDMIKDYRTNGFSSLIKRRFVIGSYVLQKENQEKYFVNAQRVRRLLVEEWKKIFNNYSGIVLPVSSGVAKKIDTPKVKLNKEERVLEEHLQIANFGGFPSITIPSGYINNLPIGINITCDNFNDELLLQIAKKVEGELGLKNIIAGEVR